MPTVATPEYQLLSDTPAALGPLVDAQVALGWAALGNPVPSPTTPGDLDQVMFRGQTASFIAEYLIAAVSTVPSAGYQTVTSDVAVAAGDTAILTASAGTYYFKVATDGGAIIEYSITTPAADQSYTAIAALLDTAYTLGTVTFDDASDSFVFTSGTTGPSSSVSVTAGTTGMDVFARIVTDGAPTAFTYNAPVVGTSYDAFYIAGDQTQNFNAGYRFTVTRSTDNDGVYTVADGGSSYVAGETRIPVNEPIVSAVVDGYVEGWAPSVGP